MRPSIVITLALLMLVILVAGAIQVFFLVR